MELKVLDRSDFSPVGDQCCIRVFVVCEAGLSYCAVVWGAPSDGQAGAR